MGFVNNDSGLTNNLKISWTDIGREYLIGLRANRKSGLIIKKFSLSDKDINYTVKDQDYINLIPNITGVENRCINGNKHTSQHSLLNVLESQVLSYKNYSFEIVPTRTTREPSNLNCLETNVYDILVDNISIFNQKLPLPLLTNNINDVIFYVKSDFQSNVSVTEPNIIRLNNLSENAIVSDNGLNRCNWGFNTFISEELIQLNNPASSTTINYSVNISNRCEKSAVECSDYYSNLALDYNLSIGTILDCFVCKFDGFDDGC